MQRISRLGKASYLGIAIFSLAACGGGGGGTPPKKNVSPTISMTQPAGAVAVVKGIPFDVELVADDPDSVADIVVFADADGDLSTSADQFVLARLTEQDGATQAFSADSSKLDEGTYMVVGRTTDHNTSDQAAAPGTVAVDNVAFAVRAGGLSEDSVFSTSIVDADMSTITGGTFRGTCMFGVGEPNETSLISGGEDDLFLARYDADGMLMWAKRAGGPGFDKGISADTFPDGSSALGGFFEDTATFGVGEPNLTDLTSVGGTDICLARYNPDGTLAWAHSAGGTGFEQILSVLAGHGGALLVTGEFTETCTFGLGEPNETTLVSQGGLDLFLARYDADGSLAWVRAVSGPGDQSGRDLSLLEDGTILVACGFAFDATFGPGEANETTLSSFGDADIAVAHYFLDGTMDWVRQAGGTGTDAGLGVAALPGNGFALVGTFNAVATFGPGEANETQLTAASADAPDIFYGVYNNDGSLIWVDRVGDTQGDVARDVAAFEDGSFALTGTFRGQVTFGEGGPNPITFSSDGANDSFVARITHENELLWASRAGGSGKDGAFGVATYMDTSVSVVGRFNLPVTFGRGDERETDLQTAGDRDLFVSRYNPYGGF